MTLGPEHAYSECQHKHLEERVDRLENSRVLDQCVIPQVAQDKHQQHNINYKKKNFPDELLTCLCAKDSVHL